MWQALRGGVDVARRALARPVDTDPVEVTVPLSLPTPTLRGLAIGIMGLLPGALVQAEHADHVVIHALSPDLHTREQFETLQRLLAEAAGRATRD